MQILKINKNTLSYSNWKTKRLYKISYFSYLWKEIKFWAKWGDEKISLYEFEIYVKWKLRWKNYFLKNK